MEKRDVINNEMDMLRGNLNRMCVTSDVQELDKMKEWALIRIDKIYNTKLEILMQENAEKLDKIYPVTEEMPNAQYRPLRGYRNPRSGR